MTFRGILVGSIGKVSVNPQNVQAILEIEKSDLRLPKPVFARVVKSSLLGGDVQVALVSNGESLPNNFPLPKDEECVATKMLCQGDIINGESLTSISSLTGEIQRLIRKAEQKDILTQLSDSTIQFDKTQKERYSNNWISQNSNGKFSRRFITRIST